ncbi:MAG: hypothetical protein ACJ77A_16320 [Actinomycetota bacterium]
MSRKASLGITVGLVCAALVLAALAAATKSYIPLFLCWIPQAAIPFVASKAGEGRPAN